MMIWVLTTFRFPKEFLTNGESPLDGTSTSTMDSFPINSSKPDSQTEVNISISNPEKSYIKGLSTSTLRITSKVQVTIMLKSSPRTTCLASTTSSSISINKIGSKMGQEKLMGTMMFSFNNECSQTLKLILQQTLVLQLMRW